MEKLDLVLFGQPEILLDGQPVKLTSSKAQALLFYLVVTGQTHARGTIATMFWPDVTGERSRRNLRREIFKLRKVIPAFIQATRRTIGFNREAAHSVDTAVFERCLQKPQPSMADLETAVACYQGEFLDQFDAGDVDAFDRWMSNTRELFHDQAIEAMFNLAIHYAERGEYAAGIEQLNSLLAFEPWRDDAHRQLMLLLALTDRRADALRQYEICCAVLEKELNIKPAAETTEIYQQILDGEIHGESLVRFDWVRAESKIAPPIPFMVPAQTNHFVGREAQLTAVAARLLGHTGQTGTALVGMGGVGKTTVAAHMAHLVREKFTEGVLWGNLANYEPRRLLEQWAEAFGYDFRGLKRLDLLVEALRPILAAKNILIIVDDVRSVSRLRPVLDCVGERPLLITTRSWELARLLGMETIALETLTATEGQALLANILGTTRVAAEPEAAEEICTLLDNLPLALEITAQRLKSQTRRTLSEMAARLRDMAARLAELELVDQAVRTSFEVSWLTLPDDLKRMFVRVAVFSGRSFAPAAMAYISELDSYTAEDKLFALADLSLLSFEADKRYYQHALLADFAREKLAAAPWHAEPYQKMARYFYAFAQENQQHYEVLRPEWENITAAIGIAAEQGLWRLVLDYGAVLTDPWFRRGRYTEAIQGYQHAHRAALQLEDEPTFAEINYQLGRVHLHQGDYGQALPLLEQSLALYQTLENQLQQAQVLYEIAEIHNEQSKYKESHEFLNQATGLLDENQVADKGVLAKITYKLADLAYAINEWEDAAEWAEQAYRRAEAVQDDYFCAQALRILVTIRTTQREYDVARQMAEKAHQLYQRLDDLRGMALMLMGLGTIDLYMFMLDMRPDSGEAGRYFQESLEVFERIGDRRSLSQALWLSSRLQHVQQEGELARQTGERALAICQTLGDERGRMMLVAHLGDVYLALGEYQQARDCFSESVQLAAVYGKPKQYPQWEEKLAQLDGKV